MKNGWIVDFWSKVFLILGKLSVFSIVRLILKGRATSYGFVEAYVTFQTLTAFLTFIFASSRYQHPANIVLLVMVVYGILRVFEMVVYQVNVLLFDEYRAFCAGKEYKVRSFRRLVLLLLHNYFEVMCWFGVFYTFFYRSGDIRNSENHVEFFTIFRECLLMMISFGPESNEANSTIGVMVLTVHSFVGIFMTVMVLARFLALLPAPQSHDEMDKRS